MILKYFFNRSNTTEVKDVSNYLLNVIFLYDVSLRI
jgi:hypothetical protein